jgi:transmembrane sensor
VAAAFVLHFRPAGEPRSAVASVPSAAAVIRSPETRTLPDGSIVELRPGAEIALEFGPAERRLMLQAGEAHFAVRSDPARPFVVMAAGVAVRAVGTAFAVSRTSHTVDILVTNGRVAVDTVPAAEASPAPRVTPVLLGAGESAVVRLADEAEPDVRTLSRSEQRDRLGWRVPMLEFARTTLAEAVPLFNRHAEANLSFDPAVGGLRLSGTLRADDTDTLLTLLHNEFGLVDEARPDGGRHLRRP